MSPECRQLALFRYLPRTPSGNHATTLVSFFVSTKVSYHCALSPLLCKRHSNSGSSPYLTTQNRNAGLLEPQRPQFSWEGSKKIAVAPRALEIQSDRQLEIPTFFAMPPQFMLKYELRIKQGNTKALPSFYGYEPPEPQRQNSHPFSLAGSPRDCAHCRNCLKEEIRYSYIL